MVGVIPVVGEAMLRVLRGGTEVSGATLTRFYAVHVAVLPATALVILGVHLYLVQRHGMSVPPGVERAGGPVRRMRFVPNFLLRDLVGWLAALAVLAALAAFLPAELGSKADPFAPAPAGIRPEWYFVFMFQTLKLLPAHVLGIEGEVVGIVGFALAGLLLFLVPFLDRPTASGGSRRLVTWIGVGCIAYILVLTYLGYTSSPTR